MKWHLSQQSEYRFPYFFHLCFLEKNTCLYKEITHLDTAPVCDDFEHATQLAWPSRSNFHRGTTTYSSHAHAWGDAPSKWGNNFNSSKWLSYDMTGQVLETGLNSLVIMVRKDYSDDVCPPVCFPGKGPFLIWTEHTHHELKNRLLYPEANVTTCCQQSSCLQTSFKGMTFAITSLKRDFSLWLESYVERCIFPHTYAVYVTCSGSFH